MERLSGLDAGMLYSESTTVPLHVCSVMELDPSTMSGGYSFAKFCAEVEKRVPAVPEFRCKLADNDFNLDHPVWVEDEDFELSRHLNRVALPAPGGRQELSEVCGHIASVPLSSQVPPTAPQSIDVSTRQPSALAEPGCRSHWARPG